MKNAIDYTKLKKEELIERIEESRLQSERLQQELTRAKDLVESLRADSKKITEKCNRAKTMLEAYKVMFPVGPVAPNIEGSMDRLVYELGTPEQKLTHSVLHALELNNLFPVNWMEQT